MTARLAHRALPATPGDRGVQRPGPMNMHKYRPYTPIGLPDRTWPDRRAEHAPLWCSVDLRDGNQALADPMDVGRKRRMFDLLTGIGFKEIEVGYPTASRDDHAFVRHLVDTGAIPDDVVVQVMTPMREEFISRTVSSLRGVPRAVLQVFNPTSEVQRRLVFRKDRAQILRMALEGAEQALRLQDSLPGTEIYLQYAPESYTQTEPEYALEICNAVLDLWAPRAAHTLRVNLPATVEVFPPQEFADRIEYVHRNLLHRERTLLSVHPHNDRGSGVAAAELAVLAGADRVEGTLFGNGERTGNVCLVTLAMNLFSQGVDPMLDLRDIDAVRRVVESANRMPVPARHPWVGDYVYTSFAGSHQDAIAKGLRARSASEEDLWDVPYLPVDPQDVGRDYKALIRINTQSGKGGIAHLLATDYGIELPRRLQIDFAAVMQSVCERTGGEITSDELWKHFADTYVRPGVGGVEESGPLRAGRSPEEIEAWIAAGHGLRATVEGLTVTRSGEPLNAVTVACELVVDSRTHWGVGMADDEAEALTRAVRAAARTATETLKTLPEPLGIAAEPRTVEARTTQSHASEQR
ncbi:2-isopropylmalate synthase [Streptomyces sp. NPDC005576]|uniref:2-isopropylmalate synthase n=1 Tax=Streptomyces sp. NPDC005576 TaxID=3364726 RepID=UPI0036A5CF9C